MIMPFNLVTQCWSLMVNIQTHKIYNIYICNKHKIKSLILKIYTDNKVRYTYTMYNRARYT